jgi:hypothetical protein
MPSQSTRSVLIIEELEWGKSKEDYVNRIEEARRYIGRLSWQKRQYSREGE